MSCSATWKLSAPCFMGWKTQHPARGSDDARLLIPLILCSFLHTEEHDEGDSVLTRCSEQVPGPSDATSPGTGVRAGLPLSSLPTFTAGDPSILCETPKCRQSR